MKYLSLFSGIGSPEQALKNLGVEFELFGFSEIDKYAIKSYCAVHGVDESLNLGDITKIDIESLPLDIDLITHGSPCQDFSVAGNGKGGDLGQEQGQVLCGIQLLYVNIVNQNTLFGRMLKMYLVKNIDTILINT